MQTAAPPLPEDLETLRRQAAEQAARLLEYEQQIQDQDRHIALYLSITAALSIMVSILHRNIIAPQGASPKA